MQQSLRFKKVPTRTEPIEAEVESNDKVNEVKTSSIGSGESGGSQSVVATYGPGEYPITFVKQDGSKVQKDVRVKIACADISGIGTHLLILSDYGIYVTSSLKSGSVSWDQAIDAKSYALNQAIGDLISLKTRNKSSIVSAINELHKDMSCSHHLVGALQYVVENDYMMRYFTEPTDLALCFQLDTKRFYYYSGAFKGWVSLPDGWAKLHYIVRTMEDIPDEAKIGELCGAITDDTVYVLKSKEDNNNIWDISGIVDEIGDEYVVQSILTKERKGPGSLLFTKSGWRFIFNQ